MTISSTMSPSRKNYHLSALSSWDDINHLYQNNYDSNLGKSKINPIILWI